MLKRSPGKAILALILVFPIAALADFNGSETIRPRFEFSLDNGSQGTNGADIGWTVGVGTTRAMVTVGTALMFNLGNLGSAGFAALTSNALTNLPYTATSINGNDDSTNVLVVGDVFAVLTNGGNYAKVLVVGYITDSGNSSLEDIQLQYYTYGLAFPHLAMGPLGNDVWTTAIILENTTLSPASFKMNFVQDNGQRLLLGSGFYNETGNPTISLQGANVSGTLSPRSTATIVLSSSAFVEGWATLSGPGITGQAVFHRHTSANAEYEATVPLSTGGTEYLVPFDATTYFDGPTPVMTLPYITGMALVNLDPSNTATINCTIFNSDGRGAGSAPPITIPPLGHTALQLNEGSGFGNVAGKIGTLDCSSTGTSFTVLGLRFLGSNDLTSFAATILQ